METEVRTLKQELVRTQEALKAATKRCRDLVKELDNRTANHESERSLRDQQLSRILRALLVLEARLKQEQKSIRQLLCEKDNVIKNQQLEIAKLRRYTKNYIKCKREQTLGKSSMKLNTATDIKNNDLQTPNADAGSRQNCGISKDIQNLKCEIITKLNSSEIPVALEELDRGVKKTHSFAGSDISKTSLTSSENTDVSIITTTTEGSPSLLSTEGFCEGESSDVSPGSTLNKSNRCSPTMVTDSENEITMIYDGDDDEQTMLVENGSKLPRKKLGIGRSRTQKALNETDMIEPTNIARTESKDDGMDCNFVSEDEEKEQEPIYVNACNETNSRNLEHTGNVIAEMPKMNEDYSNNNNNSSNNGSNNNNSVCLKMEIEEHNAEETSGNWYSDPDEDKVNDDVFRHSTYRPNSKHNSVLECVNQILLRDMEEEESILSIPRKFKHRGRIVRFQPAKLSDIESVGSEMERKNSEEGITEKELASNELTDVSVNSFEPTATEDEFGMSLTESTSTSNVATTITNHESSLEEESEESKAIPIVIIEPKVEVEETRHTSFPSSQVIQKTKTSVNASNPPLKLERIEEKTCLQMSTKGLTIAKNLDYEDIESLPEIISPPPKTPPALPPKPQFKNNTLILKKIPSPSFLIDETRKKQQLLEPSSSEHSKKIFGFISSPLKSAGINVSSARSLNFDDAINKVTGNNEEGNFWKNRFNNVRSSFQTRQSVSHETNGEQTRKIPRVTNIVRHFEEFKIGGESEDQTKERTKTKEKHVHSEFDQEFDIRQNFEEFNLDECDLSDDPDRPEGDGSERLGNLGATVGQNEKTAATKDNNNVPLAASNSSSGYDHFLETTGLSNKSILTPSRLLSNHKSMLKPKDVKYKNKIKATAVMEKHGVSTTNNTTHIRHWTGPFV
ncbi:probable serine/threonine-protein kinase DDB_G0282963 isoform X4 [Bombus terrestris]|nr:probable serine/threonine-protein kinase DDB_G0282963 isoform X4 [Bombus terrestris]XP_020723587.1 probable serine/threonine-protein kinase DDB_G0282963 isoform X4 [Bombus terrestris]XP_020723588.1 probable serine/threonine-protein kinase DDB_G0282963 isoform X4 [Bombus terrestris]XP_048260065.1 probable serine/threonine-protein kinase DDB_G0282963 isoform X4 [Bombus terrestris]XP_048260066.1 probable serine/threonine-protein kinase DDB_G0282963 isoform X4 [Bombus terrestris]XP_048260067.1 